VEKRTVLLHPETLIGMQYCYQKLSQFSHGKKVVDEPASNKHGVL
jgi:hypothetical protein